MDQLAHYAKQLDSLMARDQRYPLSAYGFVLTALHATVGNLQHPRHISGQELAQGFRRFALEQFGPMTLTVLERWSIRSTEDVGRIVFNLIDVGLLNKSPGDRLEDFQRLYDFQEAFGGPYPYLTHPSPN